MLISCITSVCTTHNFVPYSGCNLILETIFTFLFICFYSIFLLFLALKCLFYHSSSSNALKDSPYHSQLSTPPASSADNTASLCLSFSISSFVIVSLLPEILTVLLLAIFIMFITISFAFWLASFLTVENKSLYNS